MAAEEADVLIIGGGVVGLCCAYFLAEKGRDVTVVEKGGIGAGASYGNAGLVDPSHSVPLASPRALPKSLMDYLGGDGLIRIKLRPDSELALWLWRFRMAANDRQARLVMPIIHRMHLAGQEIYGQFAAMEGFDFPMYRNGWMRLFATDEGLKEGKDEAFMTRDVNVDYEHVEPAQLTEIVPQAAGDLKGGIFFPGDNHIDPAAFLCNMAAKLKAMGAAVHTETEVYGFASSAGAIDTVHTTRGSFAPKTVVLAAGAWSPPIGKQLGMNIPIQPAKGYAVIAKRPDGFGDLPVFLDEDKVAVSPMGDRIRFTGALEMSGLDDSIDRVRIERILQAVRRYLPGVGEPDVEEVWRGFRPCSPDGLPIVGTAPTRSNLILATGHGMIGMSTGPVTGRIVAQLAAGERPEMELVAMSPGRFK